MAPELIDHFALTPRVAKPGGGPPPPVGAAAVFYADAALEAMLATLNGQSYQPGDPFLNCMLANGVLGHSVPDLSAAGPSFSICPSQPYSKPQCIVLACALGRVTHQRRPGRRGQKHDFGRDGCRCHRLAKCPVPNLLEE